MKNTFTQSMAWLHTWGGLIAGWLLFAIFATGTLAVFDKEIDHWMHPEIPAPTVTTEQALNAALGYLRQHHPDAETWNIGLPTERSPSLEVSAGERRRGGSSTVLDPVSGSVIEPRESAGGGFFFRFHFTLNLPRNWGIWLVGGLAMAMLAGLVSGIVIHKKIFKEFFTFRPGKGQRSWLDFHNASAVLLLPFHLMITYTGLVIFLFIYMPAARDVLFTEDARPAHQQGGQGRGDRPVEDVRPGGPTDYPALLSTAESRMGTVGSLSIEKPGSGREAVEMRPVLGNQIALTKGVAMRFDGASGEVLRDVPQVSASQLTHKVMSGLHFAQFGGYPMRWLYFLCGLVSSLMIASGLVLFCVKRRRKYSSAAVQGYRGFQVAEVLNVAFIAGITLACVGFLWANRLIPEGLPQRAMYEVRSFFGVWLLALGYAVWRGHRRAWPELLVAAAVLCTCLPLLGLADEHRDKTRVLLELTGVALGALLAACAWKVSRPPAEPIPRRAPLAQGRG